MNNQPPIQPESVPESINVAELEAKKVRFFRRVKLAIFGVVIFVIVSVALGIAGNTYVNNRPTYTEPEKEVPSTNQPFPIENDPNIAWDLFKSDRFLFAVEYPHADDFRELEVLDPNSTTYQISYAKSQPADKLGTQDITDGYYVQITPKKLTNLNSYEAAIVKQQNFASMCSDITSIGKVQPIILAEIEGHYFTAINCKLDFWIAYVPYGDYMFEVVQAYKGDLGYKQAYETITDNIVKTIKFIDNSTNELPPTLTYESEFEFSISYPSYLSKDCCDVPKPPMQNLTSSFVLAETDTKKAIGLFTEFKGSKLTLEEYVEKQKQILIDEFTIVKGGPPSGETLKKTINDREAIVLNNYSWQGNNILYIEVGKGQVLAISNNGITENVYNDIINSLEVN